MSAIIFTAAALSFGWGVVYSGSHKVAALLLFTASILFTTGLWMVAS